jgi:hypothetical protein
MEVYKYLLQMLILGQSRLVSIKHYKQQFIIEATAIYSLNLKWPPRLTKMEASINIMQKILLIYQKF